MGSTGDPTWTGEDAPDLTDGLRAFDLYKKKDPTKGPPSVPPSSSPSRIDTFFITVVVRFKAVGNAPIMKQNFFKVTVSNRFQAVIQFLRKELGWKAGEPLVRSLNRSSFVVFDGGKPFWACLVHVHQPRVLSRARRHRRQPVPSTRPFISRHPSILFPTNFPPVFSL